LFLFARVGPPLFGPSFEPRVGVPLALAIVRAGAGFVPSVIW
jgi:hypothetical protein